MNAPEIAAKYSPIQTHVDFEDLALPRDIFNNRFRYFFITHPYFTFCLLAYAANICICSVSLMIAGPMSLPIFDLLFTGILASMFLAILSMEKKGTNSVKEDPRNALSLLGEVVKSQPGFDTNKWDYIAARLNKVFHNHDNYITPYFFYDGSDCASCFKRWYFYPYADKIEADSAHINESDIAVASKPGNANTNGSDSANISGIKPMLHKAIKAYNDSLEEYWRQYTERPSEGTRVADQNDVSNKSSKTERISMTDF